MIKINNYEVVGWQHAITGMRNPMNSWEKSDSKLVNATLVGRELMPGLEALEYEPCEPYFSVGPADHELMMKLAKGGPVHAKYRRMVVAYIDITAPLYWWKEFDTYKVGTATNSCSTMHKIHSKQFELSDFSTEHLMGIGEDGINDHVSYREFFNSILLILNTARYKYLETKDKKYWWQMIQLLPSSYNQRRMVMLNYEVLHDIYISRKDHKLDEWRNFCKFIEEELPYPELITCKQTEA